MSLTGSLSNLKNLRVAVACGDAFCDSDEGHRFLQRRLALFGIISFAFCSSLFVAFNALQVFLDSRDFGALLTEMPTLVHLAACLVFLGVWWICRGALRPRPVLAAVDIFSVLAVATAIGITYNEETLLRYRDHNGVLGLAIVLFARSFIVPSSAFQTLVSGSLAAVPVVLGYGLSMAKVEAAGGFVGPSLSFSVALVVVWTLAAILTSTVSSHILFGLQNEVHEAKQYGQYTLERRIGQGGMGEVFRARHALLRRPTAIKLLRSGQGSESHIARFEREVQLTSQLSHPNTIAIYDFGRTPDGTFYYAMEYLEGFNLEELVRRTGPLSPARAIHILDQICASLAEAHDRGLVHRDIKPANIILCLRGGVADFVKVLDFGLVRPMDPDRDSLVTAAHTITGSPMYLSPEAIREPDSVDARSDLYALGAVAYFLLTARHIFDGDSAIEIIGHHLHSLPLPPSARSTRPIPPDLERVVVRCLEKDRERRPTSAGALRRELHDCADAGGWSEAEALAWWERHPRGPTSGSQPSPARPDAETVAIDLAARSLASTARGEDPDATLG